MTDDNILMPIWTVYARPKDYPDLFVARRFDIVHGELQACPSDDVVTASSLQELREMLPMGLTRLPRHADDEPQIVEVWI